MACFLSSFRYSETEFSSLLKYVRYEMASSYSDYTTVTFLKGETRQNKRPCSAQPPAEPSSKAPSVSSPLSSAQSPEVAVCCPCSLLCLLSCPQRPQFFSLLWLWVLRLRQESRGLELRLSSSLFPKVPGSGMLRGWDVKSQNCLGHFFLLPIPI